MYSYSAVKKKHQQAVGSYGAGAVGGDENSDTLSVVSRNSVVQPSVKQGYAKRKRGVASLDIRNKGPSGITSPE